MLGLGSAVTKNHQITVEIEDSLNQMPTTVKTKLALRPVHNPATPSSLIISMVVARRDWDLSSSCCRVATTETGIVKTCPNAPASAPRTSSALLSNSSHYLMAILSPA